MFSPKKLRYRNKLGSLTFCKTIELFSKSFVMGVKFSLHPPPPPYFPTCVRVHAKISYSFYSTSFTKCIILFERMFVYFSDHSFIRDELTKQKDFCSKKVVFYKPAIWCGVLFHLYYFKKKFYQLPLSVRLLRQSKENISVADRRKVHEKQ